MCYCRGGLRSFFVSHRPTRHCIEFRVWRNNRANCEQPIDSHQAMSLLLLLRPEREWPQFPITQQVKEVKKIRKINLNSR